MNIHWKDWYWSWSSSTLPAWGEEPKTPWKDSLEKTPMLGKIEGKRRRGRQRKRWLASITNSMDMSFSKCQEIVDNWGAWCAAVHDVAKSRTWLNNNNVKRNILVIFQYFKVISTNFKCHYFLHVWKYQLVMTEY